MRRVEQREEIPAVKQTGALVNEVVRLCGRVMLVGPGGGLRDVPAVFPVSSEGKNTK